MNFSFKIISKFLGANEFMPQSSILKFLAKYGCELTEAERYICENTIFIICGFDKDQFNAVSVFYFMLGIHFTENFNVFRH